MRSSQPKDSRLGRPAPAHAALALLAACAAAAAAQAPVPLWVEAEHYTAQQGSRAPSFSMPGASGGSIVDNDWGSQAGHFLRYKVEVPEDLPDPRCTLRYARETTGDAVVRLTVDGRTDQGAVVKLPSTGDWGFKSQGWRYATVSLPALSRGSHTLEIRSEHDRNNVNFDGFYVSATPLITIQGACEPVDGPALISALDGTLFPLPCKTPVALPYARVKATVAGNGQLQSLVSTPQLAGMGGNVPGSALRVLLNGLGPWQSVTQSWAIAPAPTLVTRFSWAEADMEQRVFAAAPEGSGFYMRVTLTNKTTRPATYELLSQVHQRDPLAESQPGRLTSGGKTILRILGAAYQEPSLVPNRMPGPLGGTSSLRTRVPVPPASSASLDLQFLGEDRPYDSALVATATFWRNLLSPAARIHLPDPRMQYALDVSLRQMLMLLESRALYPRVLKGLEHYYGSNPYDTFQVSRSLDSVGMHHTSTQLLHHQLAHLKKDGTFEMWETGDLNRRGVDQWIVQGLAACALWNHYELSHDEAWLREIAPALVKAAQATLAARREHSGPRQQGAVRVEGWLPPIGGDGGLGVGYHWSQNAGPIAGVRVAAMAACKLNLPEAAALEAGAREFQQAYDAVCEREVKAASLDMIPAFPGAEGRDRTHPLWGVVMSATTFDAIPANDPAALGTLRFLQSNVRDGLHLNLGYSSGVWPYLSAEVALWHMRLGEFSDAWQALDSILRRASSTVCWYEEIDANPPRGHGDSADIWASAETVYLTRNLLASQTGPLLRICPGMPAGWMRPGQQVEADKLPITGGHCSFQIRFSESSAAATLSLDGKLPEKVRICLSPTKPPYNTMVRVEGAERFSWDGGDLVLDKPRQSVRVAAQFPGSAPAKSSPNNGAP